MCFSLSYVKVGNIIDTKQRISFLWSKLLFFPLASHGTGLWTLIWHVWPKQCNLPSEMFTKPSRKYEYFWCFRSHSIFMAFHSWLTAFNLSLVLRHIYSILKCLILCLPVDDITDAYRKLRRLVMDYLGITGTSPSHSDILEQSHTASAFGMEKEATETVAGN